LGVADRLGAIVGIVPEEAVIQDPSTRQVAGEEGKLLAHPLDQLLRGGDTLPGEETVVEDETQARLAVKGDDPEPEALAHEMVRSQPEGRVSGRAPAGVAPEVHGREARQLLDVYEAVDPEEGRTVTNAVWTPVAQRTTQHPVSARSVHDPIRSDLVTTRSR